MFASFLSTLFVVIAVTAFLRLAKRYFRAPSSTISKPEPLITERQERARKSWAALTLVLMFALATATGIMWFFLFCTLGDYVMKPGPDVVFQIDPRHFFWCVPSFFLGIISAGLLAEFLLRWLGGARYAAFKAYSQARSGIDGNRLMRWIVLFAGLPALAFVVCQMCDVTRFSSTGVTLGNFGQFSHHSYAYSQVKSLRFLPLTLDAQGHVKDRPEFQIEFKDGASWSTESFFRDMSPAYDRRVFEYAARQSGVSITTINRAPE